MGLKLSAVDLFCGAGGLTYGLERAGISVNAIVLKRTSRKVKL